MSDLETIIDTLRAVLIGKEVIYYNSETGLHLRFTISDERGEDERDTRLAAKKSSSTNTTMLSALAIREQQIDEQQEE